MNQQRSIPIFVSYRVVIVTTPSSAKLYVLKTACFPHSQHLEAENLYEHLRGREHQRLLLRNHHCGRLFDVASHQNGSSVFFGLNGKDGRFW